MSLSKSESAEIGACDADDFECQSLSQVAKKKEEKPVEAPSAPAAEASVMELKQALAAGKAEEKEALAEPAAKKAAPAPAPKKLSLS